MDDASHTDLAEPLGATDHILGPATAPAIVIEYGDFECPRCKAALPAVGMLRETFGNNVRFAYRHYPLIDAHPHALEAAQAAEAAGAQGKFWQMHDLLFENQTRLETANLRSYAEQLGLDVDRFTTDLEDGRYLEYVRAQMASGKRSGVRSSPGFFVNGRIQDVSFGLHQLIDATNAIVRGTRHDGEKRE